MTPPFVPVVVAAVVAPAVAAVAALLVPPLPLRAAPLAPLVAVRLTRWQPLLQRGMLAAGRRVGARRHRAAALIVAPLLLRRHLVEGGVNRWGERAG